jgi:hypothetical protein
MGKIDIAIANFYINVKGLVKTLFVNRIFWDHSQMKDVDCTIHSESTISGPYTLKYVSVDRGTYISKNSNIS